MIRERDNDGLPGLPIVFALLAAAAALVWTLVSASRSGVPSLIVGAALGIALVTLLLAGVFMVNPNEAKVDRKSTRLNSSHIQKSRMPSSA